MADDAIALVRKQVGLRLAEIQRAGRRVSPLDFHACMDSIRQLAADNGLAALETLAHNSAQRALLPGHRVAMMSCLQHMDEAIDSRSPADTTAILAALAMRLH